MASQVLQKGGRTHAYPAPASLVSLAAWVAMADTQLHALRLPNGRTMPVYGFPGGGQTTFEAGAVMAGDLNPQKARLLLMLLLHQGKRTKAELQTAFDR